MQLSFNQFLRTFDALRCIALPRAFHRGTPIFLFQMGKVGSQAIERSLRRQFVGPVFYAHVLAPYHQDWRVRWLCEKVILAHRPLRVISLVREPVSRNVSAFFQNFQRDVGVAFEDSSYTTSELVEIFLEKYDHSIPLRWFDENIKQYLGIDVYDVAFTSDGAATYDHGTFELLVLKAELSNELKQARIADFLAVEDFIVSKHNVSSRKPYASAYKEFMRTARLPASYLREMLNSRYCQHFYSKDEIDRVFSRWTKERGE